ncbi:MAG: carbohydrate ABC transporter permease [Clostridia bacterium]|nr:carbohydrate ABC transporter permease [Clostridia bacterium]
MNKQIFASELMARVWKLARFLIIVGLSFILLYPILYMISMSVRSADQVADPSVIWIPKTYTLENFVSAVKYMEYDTSFHTSMTVSLTSSILCLISCSLAGYGLARFKFRGKEVWFTFVIMTLIVPAQAVTIPMYLQYQNFSIPIISPIMNIVFETPMPDWLTVNLIDTWFVFWLPAMFGCGIRAGLYIYIFRQFFRSIPHELEEAAQVDGAGYFKTFYRIMVPNAGSAYLTVFIFSLVWYWNDTFYTNVFLSGKSTMAKALSGLGERIKAGIGVNEYRSSPIKLAGCLLFIIPLMIMYIFLQNYFVESVEKTGIVG